MSLIQRISGWLMGTVLLASPVVAVAQDNSAPPAEVRRTPVEAFGQGGEVALGGGVMNFTGSTARAMTGVAGNWNLRLGFGTRSLIGVELAYLGSAQSIDAVGLDPNAVLVGNGAEAVLRLNAPIGTIWNGMVTPFILGGIGWNHYSVTNDSFNTSMVKGQDNVGMVPLGAGVAATYRGFVADARFTYRLAFNEALLGSASLNNWAATANVGYQF